MPDFLTAPRGDLIRLIYDLIDENNALKSQIAELRAQIKKQGHSDTGKQVPDFVKPNVKKKRLKKEREKKGRKEALTLQGRKTNPLKRFFTHMIRVLAAVKY